MTHLRMTPKQEHDLFLKKCKKEKIKPTSELFSMFQEAVRHRQSQLEAWLQSDEGKAFEKERVRKQQRTVAQTIQEDGAIQSPLDGKYYVTVRSWEDHVKANNVVEAGNEIANKRKKRLVH